MHKMLINELELALTIKPVGPIMIKEQSREAEGGGTSGEMKFVKTQRHTGNTVYLPGSSLKGTLRSHCEKIARTLGAKCCNPFLITDTKLPDCFCGKRIEEKKNLTVAQMYKEHSCRVCKLFGSTGIGSRFFIEDAYPSTNQTGQTRTNVAISRTDGSVAAGPFQMEVITQHPFHTTIHIRNFELWQLGLLGLTLRDLSQERIRIGFAKSRGLGKVSATVSNVKLTYHGYKLSDDRKNMVSLNGRNINFPLFEDTKLKAYGVGKLAGGVGEEYGYSQDDETIVPIEETVSPEDDWISVSMKLTDFDKQITPLLRQCVDKHWIPIAQLDCAKTNQNLELNAQSEHDKQGGE